MQEIVNAQEPQPYSIIPILDFLDTPHKTIEIFILSCPALHYHLQFYKCLSCRAIFITKTGALNHSCPAFGHFNNFFQVQRPKPNHIACIKYILRYIAIANASIKSFENLCIIQSYKALDETFEMPSKNKLHRLMISMAADIHEKTMHELQYQTVSLMMDGCKRWGYRYEGFVIYTCHKLYYFGVIPTKDETHLTLANVIKRVMTEFDEHHIRVVAITTDNASNNITALNFGPTSAQGLSGHHFIRQPCAAHTLNLAIEDVVMHSDLGKIIYNNIQFLLRNVPKGTVRAGYNKQLETIRWMSLFECAQFIYANSDKYINSLNVDVVAAYIRVEQIIPWAMLDQILLILKQFLLHIEADLSSIANIIPPFLECCGALSTIENKVANLFLEKLINRFTKTCPIQLPWVAYLLTLDGLNFYRTHEDLQEAIYDAAMSGLNGYLNERKPSYIADYTQMLAIFDNYLRDFDLGQLVSHELAFDCWADFKNPMPFTFKLLARDILLIPSSEAPVERVFSALTGATTSHMCNLKPETVNARLTIKFDTLFLGIENIKYHDLVTNAEQIMDLKNRLEQLEPQVEEEVQNE